MINRSNVRNISNFFTKVDDISEGLNKVMDTINESVFGVELSVKGEEGEANKMLVTPPHIRFSEYTDRSSRELVTEDLTYYEGYLSQPFFLPLYWSLNGDFLYDMDGLTEYLEKDEYVFMQWLFRKGFNWRDKAIDMYASYLVGNDYPIALNIGRAVQDRTLQALNRIASYNMSKDYIDEVDTKVLSKGFRFQLRVGVKSDRPEEIKEELESILTRYDSYNALRLFNMKDKHMDRLIEECILTHDTLYDILSEYEIKSLFGGNDKPIEVLESSQETVIEETPKTSDIIELLPIYEREEVSVDESIVTLIAEALKRVGLVKTARIFNEEVTAGIRLTVVQFDIPKDKTITHLEQKRKAIQAAMGIPSLAIEQGEEPDTVKFLIPHEEPAIISLREIIESPEYQKFRKENPLSFVVGVDEINNPIFLSLVKLVHLLVAGTTGSGKSVFLNSLAVSLLLAYTPKELKFYMIDPKEVELQQYEGIPHVEDVITDMSKAALTLMELVNEMEDRYTMMKEAGVKNILAYNKKMSQEPMPYVVCIIDEYADLKDTNPEVEDYVSRLGQKARAAGIHLVIATQRPSADIISGRVKAVIPNAISFNLNNNTNYKTVFGVGQPYSLLGRGDGVMKIEGYPKEFQRFQSAIISPDDTEEEEVYQKIANYYKGTKPEPELEIELGLESEQEEEIQDTVEESEDVSSSLDEDTRDLLYKLKQIIATSKETRVSNLQKLLGVRTTRVQELMRILVNEGWLVKHESKSKGYEIVISSSVLEEWKVE